MAQRLDFDPLRAAAWSVTWGVGVALGVALGSYLTVVSGAGAPGASALGDTEEWLLPLYSGAVVFAISFFGRLFIAWGRTFAASDPRGESDRDGNHAEDQEVAR